MVALACTAGSVRVSGRLLLTIVPLQVVHLLPGGHNLADAGASQHGTQPAADIVLQYAVQPMFDDELEAMEGLNIL
jgi:hypothetical protein